MGRFGSASETSMNQPTEEGDDAEMVPERERDRDRETEIGRDRDRHREREEWGGDWVRSIFSSIGE